MANLTTVSANNEINQHLSWNRETEEIEFTHIINNAPTIMVRLGSHRTYIYNTPEWTAKRNELNANHNINYQGNGNITEICYERVNGDANSPLCQIFPEAGSKYCTVELPHLIVVIVTTNGGAASTTHGEAL